MDMVLIQQQVISNEYVCNEGIVKYMYAAEQKQDA